MSGEIAAAMREAGLLLRLDARRVAASVRRPSVGAWVGAVLPPVALAGALALAGTRLLAPGDPGSAALLGGFLTASAVAFFGYGMLFRPEDDAFLRRLGFSPGALYLQRALRLLAVSLGAALALAIPAALRGASAGVVAAPLSGALVAWGSGLLAMAGAAREVSSPDARPGAIAKAAAGPDRELAAAAAVVYAPLLPLLLGIGAAAFVSAGPLRALPVSLAALLLAALGARPFVLALPRFAPRAAEMAFEPVVGGAGGQLVVGRGLAGLLPRPSALALARDQLIGGRRYPWAARAVWPVAIPAFFVLARWGTDPAVRAWVSALAGGVLLVQAAALVGIGRLERGGIRWLDRAVGIGRGSRMLGRWGWGAGLSLWLTVPIAVAWSAWVRAGPGWSWIVAGAATSAAAASLSVLVSERSR
jgi:hypothetical protein